MDSDDDLFGDEQLEEEMRRILRGGGGPDRTGGSKTGKQDCKRAGVRRSPPPAICTGAAAAAAAAAATSAASVASAAATARSDASLEEEEKSGVRPARVNNQALETEAGGAGSGNMTARRAARRRSAPPIAAILEAGQGAQEQDESDARKRPTSLADALAEIDSLRSEMTQLKLAFKREVGTSFESFGAEKEKLREQAERAELELQSVRTVLEQERGMRVAASRGCSECGYRPVTPRPKKGSAFPGSEFPLQADTAQLNRNQLSIQQQQQQQETQRQQTQVGTPHPDPQNHLASIVDQLILQSKSEMTHWSNYPATPGSASPNAIYLRKSSPTFGSSGARRSPSSSPSQRTFIMPVIDDGAEP